MDCNLCIHTVLKKGDHVISLLNFCTQLFLEFCVEDYSFPSCLGHNYLFLTPIRILIF